MAVVRCMSDEDDDNDDDDDVTAAAAERGWGKTRKAAASAASMMVVVALLLKDNIHNNILDGLTSANLRSSICTYNGFRSNVKTSFAPINYFCNRDKWIQAKNVINRRKFNFILSTLSLSSVCVRRHRVFIIIQNVFTFWSFAFCDSGLLDSVGRTKKATVASTAYVASLICICFTSFRHVDASKTS